MIRRIPLEQWRGGAHVGQTCDHCTNTAAVALVHGRMSMLMCGTCSPESGEEAVL